MSIIPWVIGVISILSAGYLGYHIRRWREKRLKKFPSRITRRYFAGLNFLLNEETDKAVDIFIKLLTVDSDTIETHLAVGKLFRRRGEVERAIRIHQNLITRTRLARRYREQATYELGQDYLSAGMLDRAEHIFLELTHLKSYKHTALKVLIDLYQQEKDWEKALRVAAAYEGKDQQTIDTMMMHCYCELAEQAFQNNQIDSAVKQLKQALLIQPAALRANLLNAKLQIHTQHYQDARQCLKQMDPKKALALPEYIELLAICYQQLGIREQLITDFQVQLDTHPNVMLATLLAEHIQQQKGNKIALLFVADYVRRQPSLQGLQLLVYYYLLTAEERIKKDLSILQNLIKTILAKQPDYQCHVCGFTCHTLHWHCPKCRAWDTICRVGV